MSTIIIVDDSETVRNQLKRAFEENGHDVFEAENGRIGLDSIKKNKDEIDVILCDVNMPEMDGLEMVRLVHEDDQINKIPIFMLTTEASKASKEMARDQGVLAWITKPFKPEKVVSVVVKVLEKRA